MFTPTSKTRVLDPTSWALACRKINGRPLDHRVQPYTEEPLYESALAMEDQGTTVTFLKGRQTGFTTAAMTLGLWHLDMNGGMTIHAVPTERNAKKTNQTILIPSLHDTKFKNLHDKEAFSVEVKQFKGKHFGTYVLGHTLGGNNTASGDAFRGLTAELILFDERATMPHEACAVIESCADTVQAPVIWNIGSAGYRGDALDASFRQGTRAEWNIPCENRHWTVLAPYGSSVDAVTGCYERFEDGYHYVCETCRKPIDPKQGIWVHNDGEFKSYHVASMNSTFFTAQKLHNKINSPNTTEESLMREIAGLPYGGEGVTISEDEIKISPLKINKEDHNVVTGIDWGNQSSWLTIKGSKENVWITAAGKVDGRHDEHLPKLFKVVQNDVPNYIAADKGFEGGRNEKLNDITGCTYTMVTNRHPTPGNVYEQVKRYKAERVYGVVGSWVWERVIEDLRSGKLQIVPGLEAVKQDILDVAPEMKGKNRDWVGYDLTDQHYAACLLMAYAIYLRECNKKKYSTVGYGNPMSLTANMI